MINLVNGHNGRLRRHGRIALAGSLLMLAMGANPAYSATYLQTAQEFAVLGASTVTNTGPTTIIGDLGLSPGTAITGLADITLTGTVHQTDAVALLAQADLTNAMGNLASLIPTMDLTGQVLGSGGTISLLTPGVYIYSSSAQLNGALVLDAQNDPNALFVFQIGSTLTTASASSVMVINGNANTQLYWNVGSSATLGTTTSFAGNILATDSITLTTGAKILCGRAMVTTAAVTMDTNSITNNCGGGDFGSYGFSGGFADVGPPGGVPEPASWAFMLIGFGATGIALRKSARTAKPAAIRA